MKGILLFIFCACITVKVWSQESSPQASMANLSAGAWQSDLKFLQQTIKKEYAFLFRKVTVEEFDAAVEKLYKEMPGMQVHERMAGMRRIVAMFKYGHTVLAWRFSPFTYHVAPVNFYWFSDGIYAEGAGKKYEAMVGAKLVAVEGMPVEQALEKIRPLVSIENEQFFKANGLDFLAVPEALHAQGIAKQFKTTVTFTVQKDGKTFDLTMDAMEGYRVPKEYGFTVTGGDWISLRDQSSTPYYLKNLDKHYYYEYISDKKTVYVRQSQVLDDPSETIADFYGKVFDFIDKNDVQKLVIDVRLNGGGNNYKNKPVVTGIIETKKINKPGKLFVIIGRQTFSACQNLVNEFSNYTHAIFVGEPTAENINFYGDANRLELPKTRIPVFLSFAWWQDKPPFENADWLAPNLAVDMSMKEYKADKDPVLDLCLNFENDNKNNILTDPFDYLGKLIEADKYTEAETEARKMIADPKFRYVNFERWFNRAGYTLQEYKKMEGALFILKLNTKLYPKSANVWDSFAEVSLAAGKKDEAITYYNKAIALDPKGAIGKGAKRKLEEIESKKN